MTTKGKASVDPLTILALGLGIVETIWPAVESGLKDGTVSPEDFAAALDRKAKSESAYQAQLAKDKIEIANSG